MNNLTLISNLTNILGDSFALRDGILYCKEDHDIMESSSQVNLNSSSIENNNNNNNITTISNNNNHSSELGSMSGKTLIHS